MKKFDPFWKPHSFIGGGADTLLELFLRAPNNTRSRPINMGLIGVADNSIDMQEASGSLEGQLVDHALESVLSLPSVMSEVTSKQKFQTNEIQKQRDLLKELQVSFPRDYMEILIPWSASLPFGDMSQYKMSFNS